MEFIKTVKRPYAPLYMSLFFKSYCDDKLWNKYLGFNSPLKDLLNTGGYWFYPKYHMVDFAKELTNMLFKNKKLFEGMKKESLKDEKIIINSTQKEFKEFCKDYINYSITIAIYFICDDFIEEKVRNYLLKKTSKENVNNIMNLILIPLEDNYNKLEKLSILKNSLKKHIKEFEWINSRYGIISPYPISKVKEMKKELIKNDYLEEYKKEKSAIKKAIREAKRLLGNKEHFIDIIQFFIYYRTQRTDVVNRCIYFAKDLVEKEGQKLGLSYEDIIYCTHDEIIKKRLPDKKIIRKRKHGLTFFGKDGHYKILVGKDNKEYIKKYLDVKYDVKELKGSAAFLGKVKGKVVLIHNKNDLNKVKQGDILVTSMTTPNMAPAMEKVAAFVTDEGGITCHASIIAREMKKPCIIGTKIATKIFKDGDYIEVNANHGVVRKIK